LQPPSRRPGRIVAQLDKKKPAIVPEITVRASVRQLSEGETPTDFITEQVKNLITWEQEFWGSYERGIGQFERTVMHGEDSDETAKSEFLSRVFAGAVEGIVDTLIPARIGSRILQGIAASMKESSFGLVDDIKGLSQQAGNVKIVDFTNRVVDMVGDRRRVALTQLMEVLSKRLKAEYWKMKPEDDSESPRPSAKNVVVGQYADFLNDLERMATRAGRSMPTSRYFQQQVTEQFATTGNLSTLVSRGGRPSGRLYLKVNIRFDGKNYYFRDLPGHWTLATDAPNRGRVATSLKESMESQGKLVTDSNLDKYVEIRVFRTSGRRGIHELMAKAHHGQFRFRHRDSGHDVKWVDHKSVVDAWMATKHVYYKINKVKAGD
jgi:hypothetical protein